MTTVYWWCGSVGMMLALGGPLYDEFTYSQGMIIMFSIAIPESIQLYLEKRKS